jgi:hypothetical protein
MADFKQKTNGRLRNKTTLYEKKSRKHEVKYHKKGTLFSPFFMTWCFLEFFIIMYHLELTPKSYESNIV